ncbi:chemotaxis protein CheB [Thiocapsa marina]|uniref:MCP methyltransferase/methylesterase, CheR/CheB with PAS/PAC sensor n=1 Tax=Thiocapsa marina 5811 TaxID=768671 RepID=F9UFF8_9GAMM|nr:chemotaxis protein CheB [Thiocapsa marina]EGV17195.1 MCP methyltransferase/methylesterase, CheR/CheB with PAS/PAC sensor [Thiocapsa marina 5811]
MAETTTRNHDEDTTAAPVVPTQTMDETSATIDPTEPAGLLPAPATPMPADTADATEEMSTGGPRPDGAAPPAFPIVGIGASAGGLAAFETFFSAIPRDVETGMAFVLVQHLAPDHKSILTELVKRYTRMRVQEVQDGMQVEPDCAYIIPPSHDMALLNGTLRLLEPTAPRGLRLPIDFFFRSLAQDQHERAICVVLSGTGSDGTLGARAIKGEGGLVIAQAPATAAYDGMPRSLIASGQADYVLPPAEMPAHLIAYAARAYAKPAGPVAPSAEPGTNSLAKICVLLRDRIHHDFSEYKETTLLRRIERRMALHRIDRHEDYVGYLRRDPTELDALFGDLLIGVTGFFRDPEAFAALEHEAIPDLFARKTPDAAIRIWVCGCSTGEEAYSIAILLCERMDILKQNFKVQIFATDIDPRAIERARTGLYPASIAADVPAARLARFFSEDEQGGYRIRKTVRDLLVFSEQNLVQDPPFSKMDLISCRNLLIYLNAGLQARLITLFHTALNPDGVLFLGTSETTGELPTLFTPLNRKWKIYTRQERPRGTLLRTGMPGDWLPARLQTRRAPNEPPTSPDPQQGKLDLRALTEQALLRHCAAAGILVNGRGDILHIYGRTGMYLEPAAGDAAMNILAMARDGLQRDLTTALHRAVTHREPVRRPGVRVKTNGDFQSIDLTVRPETGLGEGSLLSDVYLVVIEAAKPAAAPTTTAPTARGTGNADDENPRIAELEIELRAKEEYLQSTLEEMETSNEELKSTNEEMQSVNEEIQSTNEELETSKEELQSVNEELATVNAELQTKVADLSRANNDMNNLLAGTGVATLFVDHQLRITRFTPTATRLIKLIQSDVGRPVGDIVSNLVDYTDLTEDLRAVLSDLMLREHEVQTRQGGWFLMRMGPYRTLENVIEGAVITFVDISDRKRSEDEVRAAGVFAEAIVDAVREPMLVLDGDLRVFSANRAFYRHFRLEEADTRHRHLFALSHGRWDIPALRDLLRTIQTRGGSFEDFALEQDFPEIGPRSLRLNARRIDSGADRPGMILLALEDVTTAPPPPRGRRAD